MPQLHLNPQKFVEYYEVALDGNTAAAVRYNPAADGSAVIDLTPLGEPGNHMVIVRAYNASGYSGQLGPLSFTIPLPTPAIPSG